MKKKCIALLSASAGQGHKQAAEALVAAAGDLDLPLELTHTDILDLTPPLFRKMYAEFQFAVVDQSPELWGFLFKKTELSGLPGRKPPLLKLFDRLNYKKYLAFLRETKPDAIVATHFLPFAAISEELARASWTTPVYCVTTDFYLHSLWASPQVARYYLPSEEASFILGSHGIDRRRMRVTGIPVMPKFRTKQGKERARSRLRLPGERFTVLLLSGGYGTGIIEAVIASLPRELTRDLTLLVVCGKNKKLYEACRQMRFPAGAEVRLYEFVTFIDQLMDASDLLITKAGGLTLSESLAKALPMLLFDPVPGQEGRNASYIVEQGAGLQAFSAPQLQYKLGELINSRRKLEKMSKAAALISHPDASETILRDLVHSL